MSDYYDLCLAVDLRSDLPEPVLDELRWHLGLSESAPERLGAADFEGWGGAWRVFEGGAESHGFDGADTALLVRRVNRIGADGGATWALTVRVCVHEDDLGIMFDVLLWLLRHASTRGWAGYLREGASGAVHHIVCSGEGFEVVRAQTGTTWTRTSWT